MHVSRGFSGGSLATLIAVVVALAAVVGLSVASSSEGGSKADTNERQRTGPPRFGFADDFDIELEIEADGRWIAEICEIPGALAYGATRD